MEAVRPRPFSLDPIPAARAILYVRRKVFVRFDLFVGLVAVFLLSVALAAPNLPRPTFVGGVALALAPFIFLARWLRPLRLAATMRKPENAPMIVERQVEIDASGVRWQGPNVTSDVKWPAITRVVRTRDHLAFVLGQQVVLMPVAAFAKGEIERTGEFARAAGVRVEELRR